MPSLTLVQAFTIQQQVMVINQINNKDQTTKLQINRIETKIFKVIEIIQITLYQMKINAWDQDLNILREEEVSAIEMEKAEEECQGMVHITEEIIPENINHHKKDTWVEAIGQEMSTVAQENIQEISSTRTEMEMTQLSATTVVKRVTLLVTALNLKGATTRVLTIEISELETITARQRIIIFLIIAMHISSESFIKLPVTIN